MEKVVRDLYAPRFQIKINNTLLPDEIMPFITSVIVEDDYDLFDKITLQIGAQQVTSLKQVTDIVNSKMFMQGQIVSVDMGYGSALENVGGAEIVKVSPSFSKEGVTLEVTAYDPFHRLSNTKHRDLVKFPGEYITGVFKTVLSKHGQIFNQINVSRVPVAKNIKGDFDQTVGKSDYEFLKQLADEKGLDFYNRFNPETNKFDVFLEEPNQINAQEKDVMTFTYFTHEDDPMATLYDFTPEMGTDGQISDLDIVSWQSTNKVKIKNTTYIQTANKDGTKSVKFKGPDKTGKTNITNGSQMIFKAFGNRFDIITDKPFENEKEAKIYAENYLREKMNNFIMGPATVIGIEALKSRMTVNFKGLGDMYNGSYYINTATHEMSDNNNYMTKLNVRKVVKL